VGDHYFSYWVEFEDSGAITTNSLYFSLTLVLCKLVVSINLCTITTFYY
jgi:hypothetical protein